MNLHIKMLSFVVLFLVILVPSVLAYHGDTGRVSEFQSTAPFSKTNNNGNGLFIGGIIYNNPVVRGEDLEVEVYFENNFGKRLKGFEIKVIIPELDIYAKAERNDIGGTRTSRTVRLPIPIEVYPKEYDMLIIARSNQEDGSSLENVKRVKWRPVEVV